MNRKKIISKKIHVHLTIIVLFFCTNFVLAQNDSFFNGYYPRINQIQEQGAILIGEMDYELSPGWKQYTLSCDQRYWIRIGAECNRPDKKACCDQQKHPYSTVVEPTVSETTEFIVPADGDLIYVAEILIGDEFDMSIAVHVTIHNKDGKTALARGVTLNYGGAVPLIKNKVKKGDKIVLKAQAHCGGPFGMAYYSPQGAKTQVYLLPDELSAQTDKSPEDKDCIPGRYAGTVEWGTVFDKTDNKKLNPGDYIYWDHRLLNGKNENVLIRLVCPNTLIHMSPLSEIKIRKQKRRNPNSTITNIFVWLGRIFAIGHHNVYGVETFNSVLGVEGTKFEIDYDPIIGKTTLTVWEGVVSLKCKNNNSPPTMVNAGMQATMDNDCNQTFSILSSDNNTSAKAGWEIGVSSGFGNAVGKPCGSDRKFVRSLYQSVLERDLEVSFATGYGGAHMRSLQDGNSRLVTIRAFFNSPEYVNKQKSGQEFIRDAYQAVLGREPSTNESNQWSRIDRNEIIRQLFNSNEYRLLMAGCPEIGQQTEGSFSISGLWTLNQHNGFIGTLNLQQYQSGLFTGTVTWNRHESGKIDGKIIGNAIEFTITYPSGIKGSYKGTLNQNRTKIINGTTQGSDGATATWDASR